MEQGLISAPIMVHFLDSGYMVENGFQKFAVTSIADALARVEDLLRNPTIVNERGERVVRFVAETPPPVTSVVTPGAPQLPVATPQPPDQIRLLYETLGSILEQTGGPQHLAEMSPSQVHFNNEPTQPAPAPSTATPRGDISDSFTHVGRNGRVRERHFVLGTGPDVSPPAQVEVPRVNMSHPVIKEQIGKLDRINEAFAVGNVKGQPFTRKEWVEGVETFAPNIPMVYAEARLSEYLTRLREDAEDYADDN